MEFFFAEPNPIQWLRYALEAGSTGGISEKAPAQVSKAGRGSPPGRAATDPILPCKSSLPTVRLQQGHRADRSYLLLYYQE